MRFFYAKKEQFCWGCKAHILYNEEAVVIRWKPEGHPSAIPLVFHTACYIPWITDSYNRRWYNWKLSATKRPEQKRSPKPKMGRPRKYRDTIKANNLRASIFYYRKIGNTAKVEELEDKLRDLTG